MQRESLNHCFLTDRAGDGITADKPSTTIRKRWIAPQTLPAPTSIQRERANGTQTGHKVCFTAAKPLIQLALPRGIEPLFPP